MKTIRIMASLCLISFSASAQSYFDTEKSAWLTRDGRLLDGNFNAIYGFFVFFEKNTVEQNYATVQAAIRELVDGESWFGGNRANGLIAAQIYYWFGDRLGPAEKNLLAGRLGNIPGDKCYWGIGMNNGGINCMTARYITSQHNKSAQVQYSSIENTFGPSTFSYNGKTYEVGKMYSSYELARDWLCNWFDGYVGGAYLHGEVFSELYGMSFINCAVALSDPRLVIDAEMRNRARMMADLILLELGINSNGHHLGGPLDRTYMRAHTTGDLHIFPFAPYFGQMRPTWHDHPNGFYSAQYRLDQFIAELCRYGDEPPDYSHTVTSGVRGGRYTYVTKNYTLGSGPNGGNWLLEVNGNDPGRYPNARRGFPMRLWLNDNPDDLNEQACSGECYSTMGTEGFQWRNAIFVAHGGLVIHAPAPGSAWDAIETAGTWTFYLEGNTAIGIVRGSSSGAVEVSRIGIDDVTFAAFKMALTSRAVLTASSYRTSRGDVIDAASGRTRVNGTEAAAGFNRMRSTDYRGEILVDFDGKSLVISKGGESRYYDFSSWKILDNLPADTMPPAAPRGLRVLGAN